MGRMQRKEADARAGGSLKDKGSSNILHEPLLAHARQLLRCGRHDSVGRGDVGALLAVKTVKY